VKAFRALVVLLLAVSAWAQLAVPPLKGRVTDLTGTLKPEQVASLEQLLQSFEARKGSQIAVLMVPTTAPETVEQYALRVGEQWKIGQFHGRERARDLQGAQGGFRPETEVIVRGIR